MLSLSKKFNVQKFQIGNEKAPLLVIDNYLENPDGMVDQAAKLNYEADTGYYPGIRSPVSKEYMELFVTVLSEMVLNELEIPGNRLKVLMCHYSLVTQPASKLKILQRIPHFDSLESNGLATVHYLFKKPLGGTAFYRHKKTGFEYIDLSRRDEYFHSLESENDGPNMPGVEYINGDTPLFEQVGKQEGVFNRMLLYRRNSLHSGCISKDFVPDPNPATGRLSINSFIDVV